MASQVTEPFSQRMSTLICFALKEAAAPFHKIVVGILAAP
jgi:hypothetical protein